MASNRLYHKELSTRLVVSEVAQLQIGLAGRACKLMPKACFIFKDEAGFLIIVKGTPENKDAFGAP